MLMRHSIHAVVVLLVIASSRSAFAQDRPAEASAPYPGWQYSGSIYLLTTPEGADLPTSASIDDFPVLIRLHRDFFEFRQAGPKGEDIRFSTSAGEPLAYQIEEWDADLGAACIWVRIPTITGNSRQEIRLSSSKSAERRAKVM